MKLTGSQIVAEILLEHGVDTVFGYPGGAALNTYDALYEYSDRIKHVLTRFCDKRPGRDQSGNRHRHSVHGQHPDDSDHGQRTGSAHRKRRVPGDIYYRYYPSHNEAQLFRK